MSPRILLAAAFLLATAPGAARAQAPTLPRVDSLIAAGSYDEARTALATWWSARETFDVPGSDRARALLLRARLAPDMKTAESDYLALVLGYPTSEHAPVALLRLGQGLLGAGEAVRAAAYLQRLVADYPGRPERLTGLLWLARAHRAAGQRAPACAAAREGLADATDADFAAMLRAEVDDACGAAGAPAAAAGGAGDYSVQVGAFRGVAGARGLLERLRGAGHMGRTVVVPGSDLVRVRVGRFEAAGPAGALASRLRGEGFEAYVVSDVAREREP